MPRIRGRARQSEFRYHVTWCRVMAGGRIERLLAFNGKRGRDLYPGRLTDDEKAILAEQGFTYDSGAGGS